MGRGGCIARAMANKIMPGIGEKTKDQKRMASGERFLGQFTKTEIIAKDSSGRSRRFDVLAALGRRATDSPVGDHPFQIVTYNTKSGPKYKVGKGSIIDGTNGAAIDLDGVIEVEREATAGFVVIQATVDPDTLECTGWNSGVVTEANAEAEVVFNDASPPGQTKIVLLLGKITIGDGVATAWQAWSTSARITHGFLNGQLVKVFEAAPTSPGKI